MQNKKLITWLTIILISAILLFLFRFEIFHAIQQQKLQAISREVKLENRILMTNDSSHSRHHIYSLKGIERIWPHRVNSLKRFKLLYQEFSGFECDIRFDPKLNQLFVAHDAGEVNDLTWDQYLKVDPAKKLFWLDVKNVDYSNIDSFSTLVNRLDGEFEIMNRIIIESSDTVILHRMDKLGYLTSYYLPIPNLEDSTAINHFVGSTLNFLLGSHSLISQDFRKDDFMNKNFPGAKKIVWDISFWHGMDRQKLLAHCNDSTILICLINVKSRGYL